MVSRIVTPWLFRQNILPPSSGLKNKPNKSIVPFRLGLARLPPASAGLLLYSQILKMETICSSETSLSFLLTIRHYIPEEERSPHLCDEWNAYRMPQLLLLPGITGLSKQWAEQLHLLPCGFSSGNGNIFKRYSVRISAGAQVIMDEIFRGFLQSL
jgi:hypothetical protein